MQNKPFNKSAEHLRKIAEMIRVAEDKRTKEQPRVVSLARALQLLGAANE